LTHGASPWQSPLNEFEPDRSGNQTWSKLENLENQIFQISENDCAREIQPRTEETLQKKDGTNVLLFVPGGQ